VHVVPLLHAVVQLPQCALSVCKFAQALPHAVCPAAHADEPIPPFVTLFPAAPPVVSLRVVFPPVPPCSPAPSGVPTLPVHAASSALNASRAARAHHRRP
jgi:hypothetical protein